MMSNITTLVNQANKSTQDVRQVSDSLKASSHLTNQYAKEIAVATAETAEGSSTLVMHAEAGHLLAINIGHAVSDVISVTQEMKHCANRVESVNEEGTQHLSDLSTRRNEVFSIRNEINRAFHSIIRGITRAIIRRDEPG